MPPAALCTFRNAQGCSLRFFDFDAAGPPLPQRRPGQVVPLVVKGDGGRGTERKLTLTLQERTVSIGE